MSLHFAERNLFNALASGLLDGSLGPHAGLLCMGIAVGRYYAEKFERDVGFVMVDVLLSARYAGPVSRLHVIAFALDFDEAVTVYRVHEMVPLMGVFGDAVMSRKYEVAHHPAFPESVSGTVDGPLFDIGRQR